VLAFVFPSRPVEIGWSLERRPVDVDGSDVSEQGAQDSDKIGQFIRDAICAWPPRPVDVVA
jgi:hypothetical protein